MANRVEGSQGREGRRRFFPDATESQWNDWRWQVRNRVRDLPSLQAFLAFEEEEAAGLLARESELHLAVTPHYLSLMDPADPADPIRRQVVPSAAEFGAAGGGVEDPLGEEPDTRVEGLVHKYPDRVLFITTNACAVYCRYCTRRRKWARVERPKTRRQIDAMVAYVRKTPTVREVLVSGGDPLSLPEGLLEYCLEGLRAVGSVRVIRIATRFPVVLPQRFDAGLLAMLSKYRPLWLVTHFNHPRELTPESAAACDSLLRAGIPLANQTVLLRGVNDDAETMTALCRGLLALGVRPYYLFQCDPVAGAGHFRTNPWKGVDILDKMRGHISGLALPTFAVDTRGGGKVTLGPSYFLYQENGSMVFRNYLGERLVYPLPPDSRPGRSE